jgi:hypothetical protein
LIFDEYLVKKQPNADGQSQRPYSTAAFHEFLQSGYVEAKDIRLKKSPDKRNT